MTAAAAAPASKLSPLTRSAVNRARLHTDMIGLLLLRLAMPFTADWPGIWSTLLSVYNVMAWVTVLTVDPTRLPESGTTRLKQRKAWTAFAVMLPILLAICGAAAWIELLPIPEVKLPALSLLVGCYMDELLFRGVLQPKLRQWGLSRWSAILLQSFLYALTFASAGAGFIVCAIGCMVGIANGWIVYKYRTLWPVFALSLLMHFLWLHV